MSKGKFSGKRDTIDQAAAYQKFKKILTEKGFMEKNQDEELMTNSELLDYSSDVAQLLFKGTGNRQRVADTVNQFRKFFNEVRGLKEIKSNASKLGVELRMLRARMGYAAGRQTISEDFSIVINDCIDTILKSGQLDAEIQGFCDIFEALYAYYYYHTKVR